ncbi:AAA domain-containing protein, partial [Frankia sp. AgKG'84/4]|uniref:AAA domain-containing protein n=1 Tax=Frankia sp. AgKG'84/4 TaxID=573490 RepID=UPI00202AA345
MSEVGGTARERSLRLLDYLVALAGQLSGRPRRQLSDYEPPLIGPVDVPDSPAVTLGGTPSRPFWLLVAKVADPPRPPILPVVLARHLVGVPVGIGAAPPLPVDLDDRCARIGDDPGELRARHADWVQRHWAPWAEAARITMAARQLYQQLYDLRLRLARDNATHELVWGHGVLSWLTGGQAVHHPLVLTRVSIELDADSGVLSVTSDGLPELETAPLDDLGLAAMEELTALRDRMRASPPDPWGDEGLAELYAQAVAPLGLDAVVRPGDHVPPPGERAVLVDTWALFVRPRPAMFPRFYAELREVLAERDILPDAFATIVDDGGADPAEDRVSASASAQPVGVVAELLGERLLLPLASNEEQERIALQLRHARGVTVQGPPGTGKSHTIANLVSHLVAHGQRVLVTAHDEQALAVLREKIPAELRDLSVAVLGGSSASLTQLHASVQMIMEAVAGIDVRAERAALAGLVGQLDAARARQRQLERRLLDLLADEGAEFTLPDGRAKAAQVADWLARHERDLGRIPDPLREDQTIPLTVAELDELTRLAARLAGDAEPARRDLPEP